MTEQEYSNWWQLHVRVARRESLSAEEQERYRSGADELDREEASALSVSALQRLRELRARTQELRSSEALLEDRLLALDAEIARLEEEYQTRTGESLVPSVA